MYERTDIVIHFFKLLEETVVLSEIKEYVHQAAVEIAT
jgi:hypothetical protein